MRLSFSSVRARLILLVLAATVPGFGLILYEIAEQRELSIVVARQNAMRVAHEVSSNHTRILDGAHQFLTGLAQIPQVRNPNGRDCSALLAEIVKQFPVYTNMGVVRIGGELTCSALPVDRPAVFKDLYWKGALLPGVAGEYRVNTFEGKSNLILLHPVVGRHRAVQAFLFAEFGLDWFSKLSVESRLPQGSEITLRDGKGTILARYPEGEKWVGKILADSAVLKEILAQQGRGAAEVRGADGILRYYVFTPLGGNSPSTDLIVSVGIPKEVVFADLKRTFLRDLTLLILIGVLMAGGALVIGEPLIRGEVESLVAVTERLASGDLSTRTGPPYKKGEFGLLGQAFDKMAEAMRMQQVELVTVTQAINEAKDFDAALAVALRQVCQATAAVFGEAWIPRADGAVLECSRAWYTSRESLGRFRSASETYTFPPGTDVAGRVWESRRAEWIQDVSTQRNQFYPRASIAAEAGLKAALGAPVMDGDHLLAVLVFFMPEARPEDERFVGIVSGVATQLGWVIRHKRAEIQEVVDRKRAESWAQSLIDTNQDAVVSVDRHGRIVLFNPAAERMFGYRQAEIRGQGFALLIAEPHASQTEAYVTCEKPGARSYAGNHVRTVIAKRKSGEIFPADLSVTQVATGEGTGGNCGVFIRDISDKIKLEQQLIESERLAAIGATAAKLAHEIGNPLNGMYMTAQLLERRLAKQRDVLDDTVYTNVRTVMKEIARLNQLLSEFRSLSRREKYNLQPISLGAVASEVLEMERARYAAVGVRVEGIFPRDLPPVTADGEKLKQALLNLCKNAAEAMPQGGTLTLRAHSAGRQVVLEIVDTGLGVAQGLDIFEPFATTKEWGTGLGLVIVRQIVAAHGGTISYASERGKGTTFRVVLPAADSRSSQAV